MSDRKLEAGAYAELGMDYAPGPLGNVVLVTQELPEGQGYACTYLHDGSEEYHDATGLAPCAPPPDSPLGRAEAEIARLRAVLLEIHDELSRARHTGACDFSDLLCRIDAALQAPDTP